jgi:hypothetical protein
VELYGRVALLLIEALNISMLERLAFAVDVRRDRLKVMTRRLLAVQKWLERAQCRVWRIFEVAGFLHLQPVAEGGYLAFNPDTFEELQSD